jgi:hypothetical protein
VAREIKSINLAITDRCNRNCPDCCCDVPRIKEHWDATWEYLAGVAECIRGIGRVILTGGEPSLHPRFADWVRPMKTLFKGSKFCIETNGAMFRTCPDVFEEFDEVVASQYDPPFASPNQAGIQYITGFLRGKRTQLYVRHVKHALRTARGKGSCHRGTGEWVSIYKGNAYPCCMGWGIDGAQSVVVTKSWMEDVKKIPLPCSTCFFAGR